MTRQRRHARTEWLLGIGAALGALALVVAPVLLGGARLSDRGSHSPVLGSQAAVAADLYLEVPVDPESSDGFEPIVASFRTPLPAAAGAFRVTFADRTTFGSSEHPAVPPLRGPPLA